MREIVTSENKFLALSGPAGTGKTESLVLISQILGKKNVVINCSSDLDEAFIERVFKN